MRILCVDDNPGDQSLFKDAMKETGIDHELNFASSAEECLKVAAGLKPDLIVMDLFMPGMPGSDFVRLVHENPLTKSIPVVFLTGVLEGGHAIDKLNVGGTFFPAIGKPVDATKLVKLVLALNLG